MYIRIYTYICIYMYTHTECPTSTALFFNDGFFDQFGVEFSQMKI